MQTKKIKKKLFKSKKKTPVIVHTPNKTHFIVWLDLFLLLSLILFFILFLFNPGNSLYVRLFSTIKKFPETKTQQKAISIPVVNKYVVPKVSAGAVYIIDLQSGTPLYTKKEHIRFLPASTTKIITALAAYDKFKLNSVLTVKRVINEGQVVGFVQGEKITFENVLYGLLVHSGNDAAYVIADNYPGGYDQFIIDMNKKAKSLFMNNSRFENPAGLDAVGQYVTAFDLSLAGRKLLQNEELAKIVSTKSITISDTTFAHFHPLNNVNKLLGEIPGIGGLKTGYTIEAKENLVTFYTHNKHEYMIVILKSEDRFEDTRAVVQWLQYAITYKEVFIEDTLPVTPE